MYLSEKIKSNHTQSLQKAALSPQLLQLRLRVLLKLEFEPATSNFADWHILN